MDETKHTTAPLSFADAHHHHSGAAERLPDLCPVNKNNSNNSNCGSKQEETILMMNDSSDTLSMLADENQQQQHHHHYDAHSLSLWESLTTLYLPLIAQYVCSCVAGIRSLIVTYYLSLSNTESSSCWTETIATSVYYQYYFAVFSSPGVVDKAPPLLPSPAFVLLALLTGSILLLVPEGFIASLPNFIRNTIWYLFESSTTCWAWVIHDFGSVLSSVLALTTFAGLFFVCYLLHRTLRPRTAIRHNKTAQAAAATGTASLHVSAASPAEKSSRSKKRRNRGRNDKKLKQQQQQQQSSRLLESSKQQQGAIVATSSPCSDDDEVSDLRHASSRSIKDTFSSVLSTEQLPALHEDASSSSTPTNAAYNVSKPQRLREESVSTVDTTVDSSFEEASVGSNSEKAAATLTSHDSDVVDARTKAGTASAAGRCSSSRAQPSSSRKARGAQQPSSAPHSTTTNSRNRKALAQHDKIPPKKNATTPIPVGSRWDALKPAHAFPRNDIDGTQGTVKGGRKGPNNKGNKHQTRSVRHGKQQHAVHKDNNVSQHNSVVVEEPVATNHDNDFFLPAEYSGTTESLYPRVNSFSPVNDSMWSNGPATHHSTAERPALLSGLVGSDASDSALNPRSPPFAPSATPPPLRPPPGLTRPDSPCLFMEPLHLSPPPGLAVPGLTLPCGSTSPNFMRPRENPFADDEEQIAADLQELGGQMVGSILDY